MSELNTEAPDRPTPPPTTDAASATPLRPEPARWPGLTKGECVLLAIALERAARARASGERLP